MPQAPEDPAIILIAASELKAFVLACIASFVAAAYATWRWVVSRFIERVEQHEIRITSLEKTCVQRSELEDAAKRLDDSINKLHERLEVSINGVRSDVQALMRALIHKSDDK